MISYIIPDDGQECDIDGNKIVCNFKESNGFKVLGKNIQVSNTELTLDNNVSLTCSDNWKYHTCYGYRVEGTCNGFNWKKCPNLQPGTTLYSCGDVPATSYSYDEDTNSCYPISGSGGKSYDDCNNNEVLKYNYLKDWTCQNVGTQINRPNSYENPIYATIDDCRTDSKKYVKVLQVLTQK